MSITSGPKIVEDGLVVYLDAANEKSYPGTGTTWFDLMGNYNSTIYGAVYDSSGNFEFRGNGDRDSDPIGDYISLNTTATTTNPTTKTNGVTYNWWMRFDGNQPTGHGIFVGSTTINHLEWRGSVESGNWRTEAVLQNGYSFGGGSQSNQLNNWINMCIVFANNEVGRPVRWYRNGILFHTGSMSNGNNPTTEYFQPNKFGSATGNASFPYVESFLGRLSQLKIYNKSLSLQEIVNNYEAFRGRYGI
jgi:hypothetical protein